MPTSDDGTEQFEIRAAQPIVFSLSRMRATLAMILLAIVVCASVAAFVVNVADQHRLSQEIADQNASRAANRAALQRAVAAYAAEQEQQRQVICLLLQRATPDAEITHWRITYRCGPVVSGPTQPGTSTTGATQPGTQSPPTRPAGGAPPPGPAPAPHPTPTPAPPPSTPPTHVLCLLGICLF